MNKGGWELREFNSLAYLIMPAFEFTGLVVHGITTKTTRDIRALVEINPEKMVFAEQVHGDNIYVIKNNNIKQNLIPQTDGLITNIRKICLIIKVADCIPIFILDSKNKAIGLIHAGWRGMIKCIAQKAIIRMITLYGSLPEDILVGFGPSIGRCCYKVGNKVISQLKKTFHYADDLIKNGYLDLREANKKQLLELGILEENIILSNYCTYDDNKLFFSYRRGDNNRMVSFLQLK
jgi:hypothetical protein